MSRGPLTVTFNGEIYNYIELRHELRGLGHEFYTQTDTEVLLAAYEEWGIDCTEHLDGMWAFALLDRAKKVLFCSRDRFGEKPFIFTKVNGDWVFASEPRQFWSAGLGRDADLTALKQMLAFGRNLDPTATYYQGLQNLSPAENLILDISTMEVTKWNYYVAGETNTFENVDDGEWPQLFEREFSRAIRTRLRSDVKVASLLSGGIDSSLVASFAAPIYAESTGQRLTALTASSGDPSNDETSYAERVARDCHLDWLPVRVNAKATREGWMEATDVYQQPLGSPDMLLQVRVMEKARQAGCVVLLDGQGADESWMGYHRYLFRVLREIPIRDRARVALKNTETTGLGPIRWGLYSAYFSSSTVPALRTRRRLKSFGIRMRLSEISRGYRELLFPRGDAQAHQRHELQGGQLGSLLNYADRASMHTSVEDRLPFLDHRLVELAIAVPPRVKFTQGWNKWLLRQQLAKSVSPLIAWRTGKVGFEGPGDAFQADSPQVNQLIRACTLMDQLGVDPSAIERCHPVLKWRLFAIALWQNTLKISS